MTLSMELGDRSYDIVIEEGCLHRASELLDLDRKCMIVTDDGVPPEYARTVAGRCREAIVMTVPSGEDNKSADSLAKLLGAMLDAGFTRSDCVAAVGGGMTGDLAGFAASVYMRGIDFYNLPTTVLSQADSSVGGKTAINFGGVKNPVGSFHQPRGVLIDPCTLSTLPARQISAGLAEVVKAGLIGDAELFAEFEKPGNISMQSVIEAAVRVKKAVVEVDEREAGLRRILNFGHTIGHGIEAVTGMPHGECVALGMIPMCSEEVRARLIPVLKRLALPVKACVDTDAVLEAVLHDKKMSGDRIGTVHVEVPGTAEIRMMTPSELRGRIEMIAAENREEEVRS